MEEVTKIINFTNSNTIYIDDVNIFITNYGTSQYNRIDTVYKTRELPFLFDGQKASVINKNNYYDESGNKYLPSINELAINYIDVGNEVQFYIKDILIMEIIIDKMVYYPINHNLENNIFKLRDLYKDVFIKMSKNEIDINFNEVDKNIMFSIKPPYKNIDIKYCFDILNFKTSETGKQCLKMESNIINMIDNQKNNYEKQLVEMSNVIRLFKDQFSKFKEQFDILQKQVKDSNNEIDRLKGELSHTQHMSQAYKI